MFDLQTNIISEKINPQKLTDNIHNTLNFGCGTISLVGVELIATASGDGDNFCSVDPNISLILTPCFGESGTSLNKEL